ncbi:TIGR01621 family pseudouridine synthase [Marinomonas agarivorans]|nr:TIGR01621 family pseudouridine synthase [Marinomonas agarivorans]
MFRPVIPPVIVAQERDYWVICKPSGMNFHSESGDIGIVQYIKTQYPQQTFYPVHRLDKMTSGLLLLATNKVAAQHFSVLFANHDIEKYYLALSDRKPSKKQGTIKGGMKPSRRGSWMLTKATENWAFTQFFSTSYSDGIRLFLLKPKTGKTHQLRVALKSISAPILGDERYTGAPKDRGYLHAFQLSFQWQGKSRCYQYLPDSGDCFVDIQTVLEKKGWLQPESLNWP